MSQIPEIPWIEAADTPWGVRVLDVRAVTQAMIATSADPQCAANALSFGHDDGSAFEQAEPLVQRVIGAMIPYRVEGALPDGALFRPQVMEHKWAVFYRQSRYRQSSHRQGRIFFVRSWTRKVHVIAELATREDSVQITRLNGVFTDEDENPLFTTMTADFLLRSHALGMTYPAPLPEGMEASPQQAALWCFQMFGNLARCATHEIIPVHMPEQALKVLL
ncbi:MAG TPA: hypothetical protein VJW20_06775 [Candidatus Angelobacter sp.]|nr:hypothetical protein [Candidatus Angelobacter sp.]